MLMTACSARVVDSAEAPIEGASGGSPTTSGTPGSGGRIDQVTGSTGAHGGTSPKYPRPVAIDGSAGNSGVPSGSDAGQAGAASADAGIAPPHTICAVPPVPAVPAAGTGALSVCAPKTCAGIPADADVWANWDRNLPASDYAGCTSVTGSIVVAMTTNTDLAELSCLEHVGGNVLVWYNPGLTTLHGLESLRLVEGSLLIARSGSLSAPNENLRSLAALGSLEVVGKDLILDLALPLPELDGFNALVAVGGDLAFHSSTYQPTPVPKPTDVSGFGALASIGGNLLFEWVDELVRVTGFGSLTAIGGSITVNGATDLVSFAGFPRLSCLGKSFSVFRSYLEENTALRSIGPFPSLDRIGGSVRVEGTPNLESIDLFGKVGRLDGGTLRILSNPKLSTVPVESFSWAGDDIVFGDNASLPICPLLDLKARLEGAGYTHHFALTGGLDCPEGTACAGTICAAR